MIQQAERVETVLLQVEAKTVQEYHQRVEKASQTRELLHRKKEELAKRAAFFGVPITNITEKLTQIDQTGLENISSPEFERFVACQQALQEEINECTKRLDDMQGLF